MIDQVYQAEINKTLDDQQRRPGPQVAPALPTFQNAGAGLGGLIGGPLEAAAAKADLIFGDAQILTGAGTDSAGGMFALPSDKERTEQEAMRAKLALSGPDFNSPTGKALRTKAKDFMPDPQATGKAGIILGGLTNFAAQAVPAGLSGPAGLVNLAADRGMQKSDELQQQGVDLPTRTAAGVVSGTLDAASLLLPMTGSTRLIAAGKGAAGGVAATVAQTQAEKMILEAGGYSKLASTYDPFDPVSMALGAIVPAGFGAAFHGAHAPPHEPTKADVTLTPAEQAHSAAVEASDWNLKELQQAVDAEKNPANKAILQTELDKLTASHQELAGRAPRAVDPNVEAAARVQQTAEAIDNSRLTPDDDLAGREQHTAAVERAADQMARGEPVEVATILGEQVTETMRESRLLDDRVSTLEDQRAQLLGDAGNALEAGGVRDLRAQLEHLQSQRPDDSASAVKDRAKVLQASDQVSYKQASALARREAAAAVADHEASVQRLQDQLDTHARAAQAQEAISGVESQLEVAKAQRDTLPGPRTSPRALALALADAFPLREHPALPRAPAPRNPAAPGRVAFQEARAEAAAPAAESKPAAGESKAPPRETTAPGTAPAGAAEHPGPQAIHLDATTTEVLRTNPDLMVQLDGMAEPMRAEDLLQSVREAAAQEGKDASLLEVAAQCALSL